MSKSQRDKGAGYEREVCATLQAVLGREVKRHISQSRDGGNDITLGKFRIECKRRKALGVYAFIEQAQFGRDEKEIPVVIMRGDGKRSLLMMYLDDAMPLLGGEL